MLMEAHEAYRAGNIDTALLKYAMLAELGYEVAQSNVAYILDHGKFVSRIAFVHSVWQASKVKGRERKRERGLERIGKGTPSLFPFRVFLLLLLRRLLVSEHVLAFILTQDFAILA